MKSFIRTIVHLAVFFLLALPAFGFLDTDPAKLLKAAESGNPEAQTQIGVLNSQGMGGFAMDKKKAAEWYKKAADQGYPLAMWNLGFMYVRGEGVAQNDKAAFELFKKAADTGFMNAQYDVGYMYLEGIGVKQNYDEGMKWIRKAAGQGYRDASKLLKRLEEQSKPQNKP